MENSEEPIPTRNQELLTSLRESIIDKPPYTSGTLQLSDPCFSLYYKVTKGGNDARFDDHVFLGALKSLANVLVVGTSTWQILPSTSWKNSPRLVILHLLV